MCENGGSIYKTGLLQSMKNHKAAAIHGIMEKCVLKIPNDVKDVDKVYSIICMTTIRFQLF